MFRPSSAVRSVLTRKAIVGLFATVAGVALFPCAGALANTVTTDFENFTTCAQPTPVYPVFPGCGSVNGQDGWKSEPVPDGDIGDNSLPNGYDQQVVLNARVPGTPAPPAFGTKSLRLSNALNPSANVGPPVYHTQTYSKPATPAAGQNLANTVYFAQFSFISMFPNQQQPRLHISVSPDDGTGGRMSYISLGDTPDGIRLIFYDTDPAGKFVAYDLGTVSRDRPHTIAFWMKLNPGPDEDLVRILIDGHDFGQCFTTWESYYRIYQHQPAPVSDRLLFLSGDAGNDLTLLNGGYLFDNVITTTSAVGGPPGCDLPIDKTADSPTVTAGGIAGYDITVHNRGRLAERDVLLCDLIPHGTTFVSASRKLLRVGDRRCLMIRRLAPGQRTGFHIDLRVDADTPSGNLDNVADLTPSEPPGDSIAGVPLPEIPDDVVAAVAPAPPISKDKVRVKILPAKATAPPAVTG